MNESQQCICTQAEKFSNLSVRIEELKKELDGIENRTRTLEVNAAELQICIKHIMDTLTKIDAKIDLINRDISQINKNTPPEEKKQQSAWQPIVAELIKILGIAFAILGGAEIIKLLT